MQRLEQLCLALCAALVLPLTAQANDVKGVIVEKSFLQSMQDCAEYLQVPRHRLAQYMAYEFPEDEDTKCLIYCVGVDLRWWNNTCGLNEPGIVNFFQPVQGDRQYEKRTNECLERNVRSVKLPNNCCQAYETFQCYFREFGNLVTCPQYVPLTKLQATQAALDCLNILRISDELLKCYSEGNVRDVPETRCLYQCIDLRTGLYTPEHGIYLSRFYLRDLESNDLRYLSQETKTCRDRIRHSGCNSCSEVYDTHQQCLNGIGEDGYTSGLITEASKIALANLEANCTTEKVEEHQDEISASSEEGYSYASYQPLPEVPCKSCGSPTSPPVVQPFPLYPPPLKPCSRCQTSSAFVTPAPVPIDYRTAYRSGPSAGQELLPSLGRTLPSFGYPKPVQLASRCEQEIFPPSSFKSQPLSLPYRRTVV
uniref:Putative odorant binding protein n=1 Tax=Anopheles marajoara TaxID=58244 RepID=A0A2M4BP08_9DIPT